jgi:hypothetical protein
MTLRNSSRPIARGFWANAAPGSNADSSLANPSQVVQYRRD